MTRWLCIMNMSNKFELEGRGSMRLGCNVRDAGQAEVVIQPNMDYIEMNLCRLMEMPEEDFAAFAARIEDAPIKIEVFNLLLPLDGSIPIVGENVSEIQYRKYFSRAFPRAAKMGAKLMVFGSARARAVPEGYPQEKARAQLVTFLRCLMEYAEQYDITVVIEPVCSREVENDTIKTVPDAVKLAKEVAHPMLFALCDYYHMYYENEPMSDIVQAGSWIRHAHISCADEARSYPALDDGFEYAPFFGALRKIGYDGRLSLECFDMNIDKGITQSMPVFKKFLYEEKI